MNDVSMTRKVSDPAVQAMAPRDRLLDAATRLFYAEGIRAVGVDRIIGEAGVTKATFYRHFAAKDDLVVAYLEAEDRRQREYIESALIGLPPQKALQRIFELVGDSTCAPGFRGCAFLNAAAEFPVADHPVREAVAVNRAWLQSLLRDLLAEMGHATPDAVAGVLMMLVDGVKTAGYLDDASTVRLTLHDTIHSLVGGDS